MPIGLNTGQEVCTGNCQHMGYQLEVQGVPIRSYQNGIGAYTIYNRAPKDVLQVVLDDYHVQEAHFEHDV